MRTLPLVAGAFVPLLLVSAACAATPVHGNAAGLPAARGWPIPSDFLPLAVPAGGLPPSSMLAVYDADPLRDAGIDGAGQTIVLLEYDASTPDDIVAFDQKYQLPPADISYVGTPGFAAAGETTMDVEVVHEIAPAAKIVVDYVGGFDPATFVKQVTTGISEMAAQHPGAIFSMSFGWCESAIRAPDVPAAEVAAESAEAAGATLFASSGDSLAFGCMPMNAAIPDRRYVSATFPNDLPAVTSVGGTAVDVNQNGSWAGEHAWIMPGTVNGTGGGVSELFSRPAWQAAPGVAAARGAGHRLCPDVAADADVITGGAGIFDGQPDVGGGTSQASPMWAGYAALINQFLSRNGAGPLGALNPALYRIASDNQQTPAFHDVVSGSNGVDPAGPGYDLATGLGSPDVTALARRILDLRTQQGQQGSG